MKELSKREVARVNETKERNGWLEDLAKENKKEIKVEKGLEGKTEGDEGYEDLTRALKGIKKEKFELLEIIDVCSDKINDLQLKPEKKQESLGIHVSSNEEEDSSQSKLEKGKLEKGGSGSKGSCVREMTKKKGNKTWYVYIPFRSKKLYSDCFENEMDANYVVSYIRNQYLKKWVNFREGWEQKYKVPEGYKPSEEVEKSISENEKPILNRIIEVIDE